MQLKILSALWGYEHEDLDLVLKRIIDAGYDGIDTYVPEDEHLRGTLLDYIRQYDLCLVIQQHQADGQTFDEYKNSFLHYLQISAACNPLLINSHTGRDYFSDEQNLELIDLAASVSRKTGIEILHETHRGRFGYSPVVMNEYFKLRPGLNITADFSHWVCVTESYLENFSEILTEAINRTKHVHARIGYEEGPQVPDPSAPEWKHASDIFLGWWDRIIEMQVLSGREVFTITTEFGPPPYMPTIPFSNEAVADLFAINCYMKDLLRARYAKYRIQEEN